MSRTFLSAASAGDYLEEVFVLTNKQLSTTQTGKPFIKCMIGDRTRTISARMWNASPAIFNAMPDGGFLRVAGKVESYQDNLQFIIDRFWIIDDPQEIVLEHLLPCTTKDVGVMFNELCALVRSVKNRHLNALLEAYLSDAELMDKLRRSPAAMSFHHSFVGGLLEHTLNMLKLGDAICPLYPGISRDLILAGVFLHDIAKTWELTYHAGFGYSDGGHLVGHIAKSAIWVEQYAASASVKLGEKIPESLINVLQHLILSHHGEPEFGAAKVPATPEAILLHYIDNIDAKMTMALAATRGEAVTGDGNFTEFQKALGVRLFRPDVSIEPTAAASSPPSSVSSPAVPASPAPELANPLFATSKK